MPSERRASEGRRLRRWVGVAACLAVLGLAVLGIPRLGVRSPVAILVICALAVLTMKLVERQVRQWFERWEKRHAARTTPPDT